MALRIRLRHQGRTNAPLYRLVVTDGRQPRDGKYIEVVGLYNPRAKNEDEQITLKEERLQHWLSVGAELSEAAFPLVRKAAPQIAQKLLTKKVAKKEKEALARHKKK